jgi:type IV pilus assembly protein PilA
MKLFKGRKGFTLIELLVVILILAILMAIALPLYLRAVVDSERQTCQTNMQTIATALQAFRVRDASHLYPGQAVLTDAPDLTPLTSPLVVGASSGDLQAIPTCPTLGMYAATSSAIGQLTITCDGTSGGVVHASFIPGG